MLLYPTNQIRVSIYLEEFNKMFGLLHVGVSFENNYKLLRYDFNKNSQDYLTYSKTKYIQWECNNYITRNKESRVVTIPWGITNYTFYEIEDYEKRLHKNYIFGIYDCRHYTRRFTKWAVSNPTPVWKLNRLWENNIDNYQ